MTDPILNPATAAVVLPQGDDPGATVGWFVDLGFAIESSGPTGVQTMTGFGTRIELRADAPAATLLVLTAEGLADGEVREAPNGTRIEIVPESDRFLVPGAETAISITRAGTTDWTTGGDGSRRRTLTTAQEVGVHLVHFADGGPVADDVHFHRLVFDLVYCAAGWVELVHARQGPPFVLEAGDAVLQPPGGRHRLRETAPDTVLVEVTVPTTLETVVDPHIDLPDGSVRGLDPRFVRHVRRAAVLTPWAGGAFDARRIPVSPATDGRATAVVLTARAQDDDAVIEATEATTVLIMIDGTVGLDADGHDPAALGLADTAVIPGGTGYRLHEPSPDVEILVVTAHHAPAGG